MAGISHFDSRVACLKVLHSFEERLSILSNPIVALQEVLEHLSTSESVKRVLGVILSYGNYMNGGLSLQIPISFAALDDVSLVFYPSGNRAREQADGFQIDLLISLKSCKSKNQQVTLLHIVVQTFIDNFERVS